MTDGMMGCLHAAGTVKASPSLTDCQSLIVARGMPEMSERISLKLRKQHGQYTKKMPHIRRHLRA
jgi:hypothetical protein